MVTPEGPRPEDIEEQALVKVDALAHEAFGSDETRWTERQRNEYLCALDSVHRAYNSRADSP
ncbi:hypothetical protein ACIBKX_33010 [Streptomyces sp. NPDC050658]|uniref:hypothetical protein n=1 Tax=unclassified Streptomyces TaxID=2593676 RepID=UPI00341A869C